MSEPKVGSIFCVSAAIRQPARQSDPETCMKEVVRGLPPGVNLEQVNRVKRGWVTSDLPIAIRRKHQ